MVESRSKKEKRSRKNKRITNLVLGGVDGAGASSTKQLQRLEHNIISALFRVWYCTRINTFHCVKQNSFLNKRINTAGVKRSKRYSILSITENMVECGRNTRK